MSGFQRLLRSGETSGWSIARLSAGEIPSYEPGLGEWVDADGANLWIVESGLKVGETVIVDGIARLRPGVPVAADGGATPGKGGAPAAKS